MARDKPEQRILYMLAEGTFHDNEAGSRIVPNYMKKAGVRGVFVGGCILTGIGKISNRKRRERFHIHFGGKRDKWICFQLPEDYLDEKCDMHALAHVVAARSDHGERWQQAMTELGQPIDHSYPRRDCNPGCAEGGE